MRIWITYYHGLPQGLYAKLNSIGKMIEKDKRKYWEFVGTLDDFYKKWGNSFMLLPSAGDEEFDVLVYVSDKGHFHCC